MARDEYNSFMDRFLYINIRNLINRIGKYMKCPRLARNSTASTPVLKLCSLVVGRRLGQVRLAIYSEGAENTTAQVDNRITKAKRVSFVQSIELGCFLRCNLVLLIIVHARECWHA